MGSRSLVVGFVGTSVALGSLGLLWSDWFLLAGAVCAAAGAAWYGTLPTKS